MVILTETITQSQHLDMLMSRCLTEGGTVHKMLDRYFSDKINKFLSIGLKIYGSSDINEILKVVEYEDIIVRDTSVRWMDFKR